MSEENAAASNSRPPEQAKKKKNKKKPQDTTLYELLDVNWDATPEELKKAYRKRALRLHPDKGGDPAEFHAMKRAYDILSDESKRATYDRYGPEMLKVLEGQAGPEVFVGILMKQKRFRALILFMILLALGLLILVPILISVKWDGATWSWAVCFVPIWFFSTIFYVVALLVSIRGPLPEDEDGSATASTVPKHKPSFPDIIADTVLYVTSVIFFAFFSARLDNAVQWTWYEVIIPWLVFEVTLVIHRIYGAFEAVRLVEIKLEAIKVYSKRTLEEAQVGLESGDLDAAYKIQEAEENLQNAELELKSLGVSKLYLVSASLWPILRFITAFLIAARANDDFVKTWFLTAIPFMFGALVSPYLEANMTILQTENPKDRANIVGLCIISSLPTSLFLLIWLLGMGKLDNPNIYSAFAVWAPYYFVAGLLCLIFFLSILLFNSDEVLQQQQHQQGAQGQTQEDQPSQTAPTTATENGTQAAPDVIIIT